MQVHPLTAFHLDGPALIIVRRVWPTSHRLLPQAQQPIPSQRRCISTTPILLKKAGKSNTSHARTDSSPPVQDAGRMTATDEAYDFSTLETQILKALEHLTHKLAELRAGGRFNPEALEKLKVSLKAGAGTGKETHQLGELAQVIPKGRMMSVVAGDEDHIKPLMSAIQASPYSLTPQIPKPDAPTTITVPIPPPTGDSRRQAIDAAHQAAQKADKDIHNARAAHQKKLRSFQVGNEVRPDDIKKAQKMMEDVVKKGSAEVKRITDGAKRVLESS
ncbi:ribosome recycling factor [Saccharata proteae CBS 121410]|uniref:Ribosome recycling factor n=1 Tax=Saccharata proteae CBS 121410 TaxID=1314787 RepID=A0A6A5YFB9_9PEZI|nr:ribosome recycling factor [Saccharata proteae CBS 121410]